MTPRLYGFGGLIALVVHTSRVPPEDLLQAPHLFVLARKGAGSVTSLSSLFFSAQHQFSYFQCIDLTVLHRFPRDRKLVLGRSRLTIVPRWGLWAPANTNTPRSRGTNGRPMPELRACPASSALRSGAGATTNTHTGARPYLARTGQGVRAGHSENDPAHTTLVHGVTRHVTHVWRARGTRLLHSNMRYEFRGRVPFFNPRTNVVRPHCYSASLQRLSSLLENEQKPSHLPDGRRTEIQITPSPSTHNPSTTPCHPYCVWMTASPTAKRARSSMSASCCTLRRTRRRRHGTKDADTASALDAESTLPASRSAGMCSVRIISTGDPAIERNAHHH